MRASTVVTAAGAAVFVIPISGLFILGAIVVLASGVGRYLGH